MNDYIKKNYLQLENEINNLMQVLDFYKSLAAVAVNNEDSDDLYKQTKQLTQNLNACRTLQEAVELQNMLSDLLQKDASISTEDLCTSSKK